jgi:glycosyltransferase involved in cell wall biosynthesis
VKTTKIAIVSRVAEPQWLSAQSIRENLKKIWNSIGSFKTVAFPYSMDENWQIWSSKLAAESPDLIVFTESMPVPIGAVNALVKIKSLRQVPFVFHVYGDFSINTHKWLSLETALAGRKVRWIVASAAQRGQLSEFLKSGSDIQCVPFPVETGFYDPSFARHASQKKGFRFFYTGRLSRQKNTLLLLNWVAEYLKKHQDVFFEFAGPFDDIGGELWGLKEPGGWTVSQWTSAHKALPKKIRERIRYHGILSSEEIRSLALNSDCYVSLSTFHDEDFGMAPVESLLCGCRALLTNWGGFASFAIEEKSVTLLPVGVNRDSLTLKKELFFKALDEEMKKKPVTLEERYERYFLYAMHFGIEPLAQELVSVVEAPFKKFPGFTPLMKTHSELMKSHWIYDHPVYQMPGLGDKTYMRVYGSYLNPKKAVIK